MTKRALISIRGDGASVATNVFADQASLAAAMHPDIAATAIDIPNEVEAGWIKTGSTWSAPPAADPGEQPLATTMVVDVPTFLMRFTAPERVAIRASVDPLVVDFLRLLDDPRTIRVNMGLATVQQAIGYLAGLGGDPPLDPPLVPPERVSVILAPEPA